MLIDAVLLDMNGPQVISISPESTVHEAVHLFVQQNIGSLPVLDTAGNLIGIFTERDVLFGECGDSKCFHRQLIKEVMSRDPVTCSTSDSVHDAMNTMSRNHVGQLPVVEDGKLVGMVSSGDLIKFLYTQAEAEKEHLMNYLHGPS